MRLWGSGALGVGGGALIEYDVCRLNDGGVVCPKVVMLKKHVLVMEFIGQDGRPAPKLTDVALSPEDLSLAYHQCVEVRRVLPTTSVSRCVECCLPPVCRGV